MPETDSNITLRVFYDRLLAEQNKLCDHRMETLRERAELRTDGQYRLLDTRMVAAEKAVQVALVASDKRMDTLNELRDMVQDAQELFAKKADLTALEKQVNGMLTLAEFNAKHEKVLGDIDSLRISRATLDGKASQSSVSRANLMGGVALLLSLIATMLTIIKFFTQ